MCGAASKTVDVDGMCQGKGGKVRAVKDVLGGAISISRRGLEMSVDLGGSQYSRWE